MIMTRELANTPHRPGPMSIADAPPMKYIYRARRCLLGDPEAPWSRHKDTLMTGEYICGVTVRSLARCQETLIRIAASGRREANLFRTLTYGGEVPFLIDWAQSDVTRLKSHTPVGVWCATRKEWTCMSLKEICHSPVVGIAWR
jgi:hypothetical protein